MKGDEKRMTSARCAYLMSVAMANDLDEVWLSGHPELFYLYIFQYFPTITRRYVVNDIQYMFVLVNHYLMNVWASREYSPMNGWVSQWILCQLKILQPAYGVYISQFIRYSRACGSYQDFLERGLLLTRKLLNQGFGLSAPLRFADSDYLFGIFKLFLSNIFPENIALFFTTYNHLDGSY